MPTMEGMQRKSVIAVIDDDPNARELVREILVSNGYQVVEAEDAKNIKELVREKKPELVILDVMMPEVDGFKACQYIKGFFEDVPVILMTALHDNDSKEKGLKAGCDEFLTKPINSVELLARVRNLIKMSNLSRQLKSRVEVSAELCKIADSECANSEFKILIIEDSEYDRMLLQEFLKENNYCIYTVSTGNKALEAIYEDDFDLVLLDLFLPDVDGFMILERIRNKENYRYTSVIIITSSEDTATKIKGLEGGANDYLIKPVDKMELNARVKALLKSQQLQRFLMGSYTKAVEKAMKDGMTGLYNNSYFKKFLETEMQYSAKNNKPLSVLMMDLDDFKDYNDTNGHLLGDRALQETAGIIVDNIRTSDLAARYGGEEFAVILPDTPVEEAVKVAERIRKKIEDHYFAKQDKTKNKNLTISIGVAKFEKDMAVVEILHRADSALYRAKDRGKNRVVVL